jgi:hypothetical protein
MDHKTHTEYTKKEGWTISELKNYLQELENDGHGDNKITFTVKDYYSVYGEEMTFSVSQGLHDNISLNEKGSNLAFSLNEKNVSDTFRDVEIGKPKITYRKVYDERNTSVINFKNGSNK